MAKLPFFKTKIAVFCIFRDSEKSLDGLFSQFKELEDSDLADFSYFFFENDSKDNTVNLLKTFLSSRKGKLESLKLNSPKFGSVESHERVKNLSIYRNRCKKLAEGEFFDYALLVDSDIKFGAEALKSNINALNSIKRAVMMTCNVRQNLPDAVYGSSTDSFFDVFAIRDSIGNKGVYCTDCPLVMEADNLDWKMGRPVRVSSSFGGFVLIYYQVFEKVKWSSVGDCEHINFCHEVQRFGDIYINPNCRVRTEIDLTKFNFRDFIDKSASQRVKIEAANKLYRDSINTNLS